MTEECGVKIKHTEENKNYKNMGRTDKINIQEDEELAEEVRKYLCLYDKTSEHYKYKRKVANAWKRVGGAAWI